MKIHIKGKETTDIFAGEKVTTFTQWGKQRFAVEVDSEGVRVYEVFASGPRENERMELEAREVWIDPHDMTKEEPEDNLQVHVYANSERTANESEGEPTSIYIRTTGMSLVNDALGTLERKV